MWLNIIEASKYIGRAPMTIRDWNSSGLVASIKRDGQRLFDSDSLDRAKELMQSRYDSRRIVPGPGIRAGVGRRGRWLSVGQEPLWEDDDVR